MNAKKTFVFALARRRLGGLPGWKLLGTERIRLDRRVGNGSNRNGRFFFWENL